MHPTALKIDVDEWDRVIGMTAGDKPIWILLFPTFEALFLSK